MRDPWKDAVSVEDKGYETPCWIWQGALMYQGYGHVKDPVAGKTVRVHKLFYEMEFGEVPQGMELHHLCRETRCCNPWHLEAVTSAEHSQRTAERKLSEYDVSKIRDLSDAGSSQRELARLFGVSRSLIRGVLEGRIYRDLQPEDQGSEATQ